MKNVLVILFSFLSFCLFSQTKEDALKDAKITSKATLDGEYETVLKHTLPSVIEMMGGKDVALYFIESTFEGMKKQGFVLEKVDILGVSEIVEEQNQYRCIVEKYTEIVIENQRVKSKSSLLGIYNKEGKYWWFIEAKDILSDEITQEILPNFKTDLEIPDDEISFESLED